MVQDNLGRAEEGQMTSFPMETSEPVAATELLKKIKNVNKCQYVLKLLFSTHLNATYCNVIFLIKMFIYCKYLQYKL